MSPSLKYVLAPSVVILLLFSHCRKSGTTYVDPHGSDSSNTTYPDASLKNYYFKPGTYWIYKDSLSGRTDSFYVVASSMEVVPIDKAASIFDASYVVTIHVANIDSTPIADSSSLVLTFRRLYGYLGYYTGTELTNYSPLLVDSFTPNFYFTTPEDTGTFANAYATYAINGATYSGVTELHFYSAVIADNFFVCKSNGIVKMRINRSLAYENLHRVWELQRSHIVL